MKSNIAIATGDLTRARQGGALIAMTDAKPIFAYRYRGHDPLASTPGADAERFLNSAVHILFESMFRHLVSGYDFMKFETINEIITEAHTKTSIELGRAALFRFTRQIIDYDNCFIDDCNGYLVDPSKQLAERLSFLESILLAAERRIGPNIAGVTDRLNESLERFGLRVRLRSLQYAARSLESALKVISDLHGWTTGKERGAAAYIDNLVSAKNGSFIHVWESASLKRFFSDVRNPDAHGAGSGLQPKLTREQTTWAIEFCMIWVKSLLSRL